MATCPILQTPAAEGAEHRPCPDEHHDIPCCADCCNACKADCDRPE